MPPVKKAAPVKQAQPEKKSLPAKPAHIEKKHGKSDESEIPKAYDPKLVEESVYGQWMADNAFAPVESKKEQHFVIPMPPPNVTGMLHLGHGITLTLEDIMIRYHRMLGEETLFIPGTDHAGIATQVVVEKHLAEDGKSKADLGREKFVATVWEWKEKYHALITGQIKKMGTSCDWSRERFTLDKGLSRAVRKVFVDLYEEGLIYKGDYLVHWCPRCQTVLSDLEINYKEEAGKLWMIRYFVKAADKSVVVATTRPETMLGDTAVAVHPNDDRYKEFVGKTLILPILNREIPVITDESVDMQFGSGALKITPAHDLTDFAIGKKHNLPVISVIGKDGKMSKAAGKFAGLSTEQARENIVEYLNNIGNLESSQDFNHNVGYCDRCNTKVEPYLSTQWFVKMQPLAEETLKQLEKEKLTFVPDRFEKTFRDWLLSVHDWCISRQLWWGHQIPAYTCKKCKKLTVSEEAPTKCVCKNTTFDQDPDVLDTWFSSALWPFSILGWPLKTDDLRRFYPAAVLETGYDIIFFWVVRMVFMGVHFMKRLPFKTVYLHGLVRDEQGRKMSKSLGNGIDPIEVIDQYGADALRLSLSLGNTPGNDLRFSLAKVEGNRNFINKLWNASRFILLKTKERKAYSALEKHINDSFRRLPPTSRWVLTRLQQLIQSTTDSVNQHRFGDAGAALYDFTWNEFCDWYIEVAKTNLTPLIQDVLQYSMLTLLKLWHPYIPFVTEKIWSFYHQRDLLVTSHWPTVHKEMLDDANLIEVEHVFGVIRAVRNLRAEQKIEPHLAIDALIISHDKLHVLVDHKEIIKALARLDKVKILKEGQPEEKSLSALVDTIEVYLPLSGLVDEKKEKEKIMKEIVAKEQFIESIRQRLNNKDFMKKANKEVVKRDKERLAKEDENLKQLKDQLKKMA